MRYDGEWKDDIIERKGKIIWNNGERCEGYPQMEKVFIIGKMKISIKEIPIIAISM